jgi:hypothetical protein
MHAILLLSTHGSKRNTYPKITGLASPFSHGKRPGAYVEAARACVMSTGEFDTVVGSQLWKHTRRWHDVSYRYALCEKGAG